MKFAVSALNKANGEWWDLPNFDSRQICTLMVDQWCLTSDEVDQIFGLGVGEVRIIGVKLKFRRL